MRNMVESNMVEEYEGGNLFDQIDDLLEFPSDGFGTAFFDSGAAFQPAWHDDSAGSAGCRSYSASNLSAELSVPTKSNTRYPDTTTTVTPVSLKVPVNNKYEDIVQLEWLSTFVEDSFSNPGLTLEKPRTTFSDNKDQFQTSSPISVLDGNPFSVFCHEKRARSKRPRPPTFTSRAPILVNHPMSSSPSTNNKKMKIKILPPTSPPKNQSQNQNPNVGSVRKCKHCEITKTPQWSQDQWARKPFVTHVGFGIRRVVSTQSTALQQARHLLNHYIPILTRKFSR